jgi:hypothetical protein
MKTTSKAPAPIVGPNISITNADDSLPLGSPRAETVDAHDPMRLTRRTVCSLGAGMSVFALFGLSGPRADAAERYYIRYVLTDCRYAQSLEFGNILCRRGSKRLEVTDGLTRLWLNALVPLWRQKKGAIAGLTLRETWFCMAEQARGQGRRSVLVGQHALATDAGATNHVLTAPSTVLKRAVVLEKNIEPWPRVMARLAIECPTNLRASSNERFQNSPTAATAPPVPLTSWIIA